LLIIILKPKMIDDFQVLKQSFLLIDYIYCA
jgi:hypothetical protein